VDEVPVDVQDDVLARLLMDQMRIPNLLVNRLRLRHGVPFLDGQIPRKHATAREINRRAGPCDWPRPVPDCAFNGAEALTPPTVVLAFAPRLEDKRWNLLIRRPMASLADTEATAPSSPPLPGSATSRARDAVGRATVEGSLRSSSCAGHATWRRARAYP
jgi:hypothetical protein